MCQIPELEFQISFNWDQGLKFNILVLGNFLKIKMKDFVQEVFHSLKKKNYAVLFYLFIYLFIFFFTLVT